MVGVAARPLKERYGRLVVIKEVASCIKSGRIRRMYLCQCDCGKQAIVQRDHFITGCTRSCGCLATELKRERKLTHGKRNTRIYEIYYNMRDRCLNSNNHAYQNYGGRGINICKKWETFEGFYEDMKDGYKDNLTLERVDNDGNYSKENCIWASYKQQARNRRSTLFIKCKGEKRPLIEVCEELNLKYKTIHRRIRVVGMPIYQALMSGDLRK